MVLRLSKYLSDAIEAIVEDMERMEAETLIDLWASARAKVAQQTPQGAVRSQEDYRSLRSSPPHPTPSGGYHYTINGWDVIELFDAQTVKMFTPALSHGQLKLPGPNTTNNFNPQRPVLRYIMAFKIDPNEEANVLLDEPITDRYIVYAMLLSDDDEYKPVGAHYIGSRQSDREKQWLSELANRIASALDSELDRRRLNEAPEIPPAAETAINTYRNQVLSPSERRNLTDLLMQLDDWTFWEAVSRLLPYAKLPQKTWLAT